MPVFQQLPCLRRVLAKLQKTNLRIGPLWVCLIRSMTHRFSEAEIQAALKDVTPEGAERSRAMRSLPDIKKNDPTIDVTENNIRLYLALKKLSPSGRVSLAQMKSQKTMAVASTMIRSKVWLVPRQNFPTIPPESMKFSVPPESLTSLPIDIDPQTIWAFDLIKRFRGRSWVEVSLNWNHPLET